jgi:hypothetical protein
MRWFKGIHYRSPWFYELQNRMKLGLDHDLRFKIAAKYVKSGDSVLDLCSGLGQLRDYLPAGSSYQCVEASPQFADFLRRKNIPVSVSDLHDGLPAGLKADVAVMIVSLCHFRNTSAGELLESLKTAAGKVVIVEDVLAKSRGERSFRQRMMNYCCQTEYYRPMGLFTAVEFQDLIHRHGYTWRRFNQRYCVGYYGPMLTQD